MSRKKLDIFKFNPQLSYFANKIAELRSEKNMTQEDLETILGISGGQYSRYERGLSVPSLDIAIRFADYFGMSLDALTGRDKEKSRHKTYGFSDFVDILEYLVVILRNDKRRDTIEGLRGWLRDLAEIELRRTEPSPDGRPSPRRKEVEEVLKKMSRKKYAE